MDHQANYQIYKAQTANVRSIRSSMRQVHRSINAVLRANNTPTVTAFTKIYALLFCGWAEANLSKILHTPYGFELDEIEQVKAEKDRNGIQEAWKRCVALGLRHLSAQRGSFRPNAQQMLESLINSHVFEPARLRNKMAHGQWEIALNRECTAVNVEMTREISLLNIVVIDSWIRIHELLAGAVETLIESPKKAFVRDWYVFVVDLEQKMIAAETRTLTDHITKLKSKDAASGAHAKRRPN